MKDFFRSWLQPYSEAFRECALESENLGMPASKLLLDSHFKPLHMFMTPRQFWEGIALPDGRVIYGDRVADVIVFAEELAYGDPTLYLALPGPNLSGPLVDRIGTSQQRASFFLYFKNHLSWSAFALTETEAGSDATNLSMYAERQEDGSFILNGNKRYIANGAASEWFIMFATTRNRDTVTNANQALFIEAFLFFADQQREGIALEEITTFGQRAARLSAITLTNFRVKPEEVLGYDKSPLRRGFRGALETFYRMRPATAAIAIGVARAAVDYTERACRLNENDRIRLDKLKWDIERGRLLVRAAAQQCDSQIYNSFYSSMAKQYMNRLLIKCLRECIDMAETGSVCEHPILNKWMRDAHMIEFMEGTTNIHLREVSQYVVQRGLN